ncbi:bifunctional proline dehydrogenase/L-glutamate gamma-semialdehyde dehydrogenase PutA [Alkalisalibacterium limincola]|uniref:bifunctional proline dehydrogenase/L-glutamate gamma-semialdehyde dehydrogenase PutA n=1 Tax=Alkalisalibacterium limincola TaxID=2699169 RepID=UPI003CCD4ADD
MRERALPLQTQVFVKAILSPELPQDGDAAHARITEAWLRDESEHVRELLELARLPEDEAAAVEAVAQRLVNGTRRRAEDQGAIEAFMREYDLSSEEGVLLMCVAEALLRIPDQTTADRLIRDKLGEADWQKHLGRSDSIFVNASTWGLMLTGRIVRLNDETRRDASNAMRRLTGRAGEPVIRMAVRQAMRIMGHQFVLGRNIEEALKRSRKGDNARYRYSFDMLGEAALTAGDAKRYFDAYAQAIEAIGAGGPFPDVFAAPSISVKLSALHPRFEHAKRARVMAELAPRVLDLAQRARSRGIGFTIDAEEADRLEMSLDVILGVYADASLEGWEGFGLAVQAYQKRAPRVLARVAELARRHGRRIPVRLVKGAYWDSEVKRGQVEGHDGYPVFTRKANTDVSYLACARAMLEASDAIYPMFATHNAHTIAAVHHHAAGRPFEFQRLHGMGADLYAEVIGKDQLDVPCRVYAPVGSHEDLLAYLVRRLLENGANTSFVNRISDDRLSAAELVADPVATVDAYAAIPHPKIPQPVELFTSQGHERKNSMGVNLANDIDLKALADRINASLTQWKAGPLVPGTKASGTPVSVTNPADRREKVGEWIGADEATATRAIDNALAAQRGWDRLPSTSRGKLLEHAADLLESRMAEFIAMCTKEAGKTIPDGVAEVREAVDFLRYYALQGRQMMAQPEQLPGPTGETNELVLSGRGVFVCISPWNFPLAIFIGQVAAALVTGNAVIAKPAEQTTLVGHAAVKLLHEAGIPEDIVQFVPGDGATVGAALTKDPRIAGVVFTGSTDTARAINRTLAARDAAIAVLIAETGGQNALIADSSALPEQLVKDAVVSAFGSAGQRCSAARILFVQEDIADRVIEMLAGAIDELKVGDPGLLSTDVGPVIDDDALEMLTEHAGRMDREGRLIRAATLGEETANGTYFAPRAYEIDSINRLEKEIFGPILHVIRIHANDLDKIIAQINSTGYGLTLGIHSRIDETVDKIMGSVRVGNCYVNRNQIGAVVGVQPFGGEGLSGTGPKAGGPHYLARFVTERTRTVNTTASGGNASLLTLDD